MAALAITRGSRDVDASEIVILSVGSSRCYYLAWRTSRLGIYQVSCTQFMCATKFIQVYDVWTWMARHHFDRHLKVRVLSVDEYLDETEVTWYD